jgi:hypothetical protein
VRNFFPKARLSSRGKSPRGCAASLAAGVSVEGGFRPFVLAELDLLRTDLVMVFSPSYLHLETLRESSLQRMKLSDTTKTY